MVRGRLLDQLAEEKRQAKHARRLAHRTADQRAAAMQWQKARASTQTAGVLRVQLELLGNARLRCTLWLDVNQEQEVEVHVPMSQSVRLGSA